MTPEDRIRFQIGDLHFQIAMLLSQIETAQARIKELEEGAAKPATE
jgi:hypothetical protein